MNLLNTSLGLCALIAALSFGGLARHAAAVDDVNVITSKNVTRDSVLSELHHVNQLEITMGKMAEAKGHSTEVRDYGARLVKDHTNADQKVMTAAKDDSLTVVEKPLVAKERSMVTHLKGLTGEAFDTAFLHEMAQAHSRVIQKLNDDLAALPPSATRSLVVLLLPQLAEHRDMATELIAKLETTERVPATEGH